MDFRLALEHARPSFDGSPWWWPYPYGSTDRSMPLRGDVARKCGWGAAVYLCRFVNDILGITVDARVHSVGFAPFVPWRSFTWNNVRIGAARFDFGYRRGEKDITITLTNRNQDRYKAVVKLIPMIGTTLHDVQLSGAPAYDHESGDTWGRQSLQMMSDLDLGQTLRVTAKLS